MVARRYLFVNRNRTYTLLRSLLSGVFLVWGMTAAARQPLYIVNGKPCAEIDAIPPANIEQMESLPADEEQIERYGEAAAHGVVLVTLRYDTPARFEADSVSFSHYIARRVKWADDDPVARVVLRYRITTTGDTEPDATLEATDKRLLRRVLKELSTAPKWQPATKCGEAVESYGVLRVQLPAGRRMPPRVELVIR